MHRKTVNLTDRDVDRLAVFLDKEAPDLAELARAVGEDTVPYSESGVLRALALVGADFVRDMVEARAYAALAASYTEEDERFAEAAMQMAGEAWRE
jgi:hypothetical protein